MSPATLTASTINRPYKQIEPLVKTGDTIVWTCSGKGIAEKIWARGIKNRTGPATHISTAVWIEVAGKRWLHIAETMRNGLVLDSFERRLSEGEKEGWTHCWWFPLSDYRRGRLNVSDMVDYLMDRVNVGTRYDIRQAIASANPDRHNVPNDTKLFCSEWHMAALQRGGAVTNCNYSEAVPMDVVRFRLHQPTVYAIWQHSRGKGGKINLTPYLNTVEPDNWSGY